MAFKRALTQSGLALQSSPFRANGYWNAVWAVSRCNSADESEFLYALSFADRGDWVKTALNRYGSTAFARFIRRTESRLKVNASAAFVLRFSAISLRIFSRSFPLAATR